MCILSDQIENRIAAREFSSLPETLRCGDNLNGDNCGHG